VTPAPLKRRFFITQITMTSREIHFYGIRHAETFMNLEASLVGGRSNHARITPHGVEQSKRLGQHCLRENIVPHRVYATPAVRTQQTAEIALAEMGLDIEPIILDDLQELSQGIHEGRPRVEVYTPDVLRDIEAQGKDFKLEGGESMNETGERGYSCIDEEFKGVEPDPEPLVVFGITHGGTIRCIASKILGLSHAATYAIRIDNTSLNLFPRINDVWRVAYLNRVPEEEC
jgi:broad specificity phosphatase PhoE